MSKNKGKLVRGGSLKGEEKPVERVKFRTGTLFGGQNQSKAELLQEHAAKAALLALRQQEKTERESRFIPDVPGTKPTAIQQEIIDNFAKHTYTTIYCRGGNQCFQGVTLVATVNGPVAIKDLQVGDYVLDPENKPIRVLAVHANGIKPVYDYGSQGRIFATCTEEHKFLMLRGRSQLDMLNHTRTQIAPIGKRAWVKTNNQLYTFQGNVDIGTDVAWMLGAMQGDGCCTTGHKTAIGFASGDYQLPNEIARILGGTCKGYTNSNQYFIHITQNMHPLYMKYMDGKKAHEKFIPISILNRFSSEEALGYLAGMLDTDGCFCKLGDGRKELSWCTQNKIAADGITFLLRKLFRIEPLLRVDNRAKYVNGPIYVIRIGRPLQQQTIISTMAPYIRSAYKKELSDLNLERIKDHEGLTLLNQSKQSMRKVRVYNITVDHPENLYQLANGLISKNSGKTQLCAYLAAHVMQENLEGWKRKERWHKEPLLLLWLSRQSAQIEESLWRKCKPYFTPGTFKEVRAGGALKKIVMDNGNTLLFFSYQNINEATDAVQSFTGHYVFLDELPSKAKLIEESMNRLIKNEGIFMAAFTPKKPSPEVKRIVMGGNPKYTVGYRLMMSDNPGITDEAKAQQREKAAAYGSKMEAAILTGDWVDSDNLVFYIDEDKIIKELPASYSQEWRHFESSDPAVASGFGFVVMAEDPNDGRWYVIRSKVLSGPEIECDSVSVQTVKNLTKDYNMFRRIADPAACNYIRTAHKAGLRYTPGPNKMGAFEEHVAKVQEALGRQVFITPAAEDLLDQLSAYERSEDNPDHVIHRKKFHLIDAFRYAIAMLPPYKAPPPPPNLDPIDPQKWLEDRVFEEKDKKARKESFTQRNERQRNAYWGASIGSKPLMR